MKDSVVTGGVFSSIGSHRTGLIIRRLLSVGHMALWKAVFILAYLALIWYALRGFLQEYFNSRMCFLSVFLCPHLILKGGRGVCVLSALLSQC